MLASKGAFGGMVTAPNYLAAEVGRDVLREGGNAVEAMVAAAAAIAVVYPHMNALGGDGFWLIHRAGEDPRAIDACGWAAERATPAFYEERALEEIPARGVAAALTVPGAVAGWAKALEMAREAGGGMPLDRLLAPAIHYAREGVAVPAHLAQVLAAKHAELADVPGFAQTYLRTGAPMRAGHLFSQQRLADSLQRLAEAGLDDFYRGDLAASMGADAERIGSPLTQEDFNAYQAQEVAPLSVEVAGARIYNLPPPTQGLSALGILGLYDRIRADSAEGFDFVHRLVEATKEAFIVREREIADPGMLSGDPARFLAPDWLDAAAARIDRERAAPWPRAGDPGDTVWLGAMDSSGLCVSYIQSIFWDFGSGVVLPESGVLMQNRGAAFSLDPQARRALAPGRKPFHTLNPAMALFDDGRVMSYGCMGGEGQPQTQATVFARVAFHDWDLQAAITEPRWLLGRTWGDPVSALRIESRYDPDVVDALAKAGHDLLIMDAFDSEAGHAGALMRHEDGLIEGASDPRCDGGVAAF